jgi:predicted lipoprotein with Yx(FWY)xxD motif
MRALLSLVAGLVLASAATGASPALSGPTTSGVSATLTVRSSAYGRILFDGRGRALYAFGRDSRRHSACTGECARRWPPYIARGRLRAGAGTKSALLGTTLRPDSSRQVTYAGRPLYFYVGDRKPGQVLCQNVDEFGGLWLVIRPSGRLVR